LSSKWLPDCCWLVGGCYGITGVFWGVARVCSGRLLRDCCLLDCYYAVCLSSKWLPDCCWLVGGCYGIAGVIWVVVGWEGIAWMCWVVAKGLLVGGYYEVVKVLRGCYSRLYWVVARILLGWLLRGRWILSVCKGLLGCTGWLLGYCFGVLVGC